MLAWFNMSNNLCSTLGLITARQVFMSLPSQSARAGIGTFRLRYSLCLCQIQRSIRRIARTITIPLADGKGRKHSALHEAFHQFSIGAVRAPLC